MHAEQTTNFGTECRYQALSEEWKKKFMDFCTGKKTLPLTYDPFFKRIFHPDIHPHRLSKLLSSLIGREVKVLKILPTEEVLLDGSALLIMDILVEFHLGKTTFDTGLSLELLQEYCLVALDVFREIPYPRDRNERNAWIGLLATENIEDAELLINDYPWLAEIYEEITDYMNKPEEVLSMFSDALKILDRNTVQYMIEEQAQQLELKKKQLDAQAQQLDAQNQQLDEQAQQLDIKNQQLEDQAKQLDALNQQMHESVFKTYIDTCRDLELSREAILSGLIVKYNLSPDLAEKKIVQYW